MPWRREELEERERRDLAPYAQLSVESRGRIHAELVETLFRYNARPCMGRFVARLEGLCR